MTSNAQKYLFQKDPFFPFPDFPLNFPPVQEGQTMALAFDSKVARLYVSGIPSPQLSFTQTC